MIEEAIVIDHTADLLVIAAAMEKIIDLRPTVGVRCRLKPGLGVRFSSQTAIFSWEPAL